MVCFVLDQIMVVNSLWHINIQTSFSVALNRKYHHEAWKFYCSRSNLTYGNTHLDRDGTHGSNVLHTYIRQVSMRN